VYVPVVIEFDYVNTGPQTVTANTTRDFEFPAREGWTCVSWGWFGAHPALEFQTAGLVKGEDGRERFVATVRNSSATDRTVRWLFKLMRV
jgi:hypothetical protein